MADKFASVAGAGAHDGSTAGNAWTIAEATASVVAGDTVNVLAGTYIADDSASSAIMDIDVTGASNAVIEWRAYTTTIDDFTPGDAQPVILNAGTNTLTNCVLTNTITASAFNRFIGFRFTGASSHGVDGNSATDNMAFVGCKFDANGGMGCQLDNSCDWMACEFTGNTTSGCDADSNCGILACEFHNEAAPAATFNTITANGCLFYDNGNGSNIETSSIPVYIMGCTFDGDGQAASVGIYAKSSQGPQFIANNILFDLNTGVRLEASSEVGIKGYNLFSTCTNDYTTQPETVFGDISNSVDPFTDSASRDYTLASGSAARSVGIDGGTI